MSIKIPLTELESKVIGALQLDPLQAARDVSRQTKLTVRSVQHAVQRLRRRGLLRSPRAAIDRSALGGMEIRLFYSFTGLQSKDRTQLHQCIDKDPRIKFAAEFGGKWHLGLTIATKSLQDFFSFTDEFSNKFGRFIHEQSVSIRSTFTLYPRKYLPRLMRKHESITFGVKRSSVVLDDLDGQIVEVLNTQPWESFRDVAKRVKVAPITVLRRIEGLKKSGVIIGFHIPMRASLIGRQGFLILLFCPTQGAKLNQRMSAWALEHPLVTGLAIGVGGWSYEIIIEVLTPLDAQGVSQEILDLFSEEIAQVELLPFFRYLKSGRFNKKLGL